MSKLESFIVRYNGEFIRVYEESEADKVIADLEKKLDIYKRGWMENDKVNANQYAEIRHHKYKRCLAMAKWCENAILGWMGYKASFSSHQRYVKVMLFTKWRKRWLAIAEKFKPNSTINKKGGTNALQR